MITGSKELSSSSDGHFEVETKVCQDDGCVANFPEGSLWKETTSVTDSRSLQPFRNWMSLYKELSKITQIVLICLRSFVAFVRASLKKSRLEIKFMKENSYFKVFQFIGMMLALYLHFNGILLAMTWTNTAGFAIKSVVKPRDESRELGTGAQVHLSREELRGSRLLAPVFPPAWKPVTCTQAAYLLIASCSFSTDFSFLLYSKPSWLFAFLH